MLSFSIGAATWAAITLDLREVTTPVNSAGGGGALTVRGWVTAVGSGSVGSGSGRSARCYEKQCGSRDRIDRHHGGAPW